MHRLGQPLPRRLVILRALQLGDLLCAVPALRALRAALPAAEITLVGLPWARAFVERFDRYLDGFLEFPGYPGLPERELQVHRVPEFLAAAQRLQFDLAIQMHGSGAIVNPLTVLLGARYTAGFHVPGQYCPDPERFLPFPAHEPEVWHHLRLMEFLGVPLQGDELEFPLRPQDEQELAAIPEARDLHSAEYVCIHPGARSRARRWLPERFAAVADVLAARGLRIVLTGSSDEAALTAAVAGSMKAPALDLAGRTSLGALAVLLSRARLLVCNDTGVSHIAAGLRLPSVVIISASDPNRWAPLDHERHRAISVPVECRPCGYDTCPIGHPCATGLTVEAVLLQADALLGGSLVSATSGRREDHGDTEARMRSEIGD